MKKVFEYWGWEDSLAALGFSFIVSLVVVFFISITADHSPRMYYLDTSSNGSPVIKISVNWCEDECVDLDRSVSYEEAVKLIRELNEGLK